MRKKYFLIALFINLGFDQLKSIELLQIISVFKWQIPSDMFQRAWGFIKSKFSKNESPPKVAAVSFEVESKKPKFRYPQPLPRSMVSLRQLQINANQDEPERQFKLVLTEKIKAPEEQLQSQQIMRQHEDLLEEMRELSCNLQKFYISDKNLREKTEKLAQLPKPLIFSEEKEEQPRKKTQNIMNEYKFEIQDFIALKYSKQKSEYAQISYQQYIQIREYWKSKKKTSGDIKQTTFDCVQKLTYRALGCLEFGEWLNDDVINMYLQMLQKALLLNSGSPLKLLNSYFATSTLAKNETQIQRVLKKKNLNKNHLLIMPINNKNHWYFVVFQDQKIVVYDSIKQPQQYYEANQIFKNALKFATFFYQRNFTIQVEKNYPQQTNGYDCGVFMLLGVRDILRNKQWSYHQGDIRFKRVQIALEILRETILFRQ